MTQHVNCWPGPMTGLPRALTRRISRRPRPCWLRWDELGTGITDSACRTSSMAILPSASAAMYCPSSLSQKCASSPCSTCRSGWVSARMAKAASAACNNCNSASVGNWSMTPTKALKGMEIRISLSCQTIRLLRGTTRLSTVMSVASNSPNIRRWCCWHRPPHYPPTA
jgi:hypothetical protein